MSVWSEVEVQGENVEDKAEKRSSQMVDCFEGQVEFRMFSAERGMLRLRSILWFGV